MGEASREWFFMNGPTREGPILGADIRWRVREQLLDPETLVWTAGMDGWEPASVALPRYATQLPASGGALVGGPSRTVPVCFDVSVTKFIVMSFVTFGLYDLYWSYRNWSYLKLQDSRRISPFWRAWFVLFFHFSLLRDMKSHIARRTPVSYSAGWLTVAYLVLLFSSSLPGITGLISLLSFVPILPVVAAVERANTGVPIELLNRRFTAWNIVGIVAFFALVGFALFG